MGRLFHIPGIFFLFVAFVLLFLVSISLPYLTTLDFARVHFDGGKVTAGSDSNALTELRFGTWADCWYESSGDRVCSSAGNAYNVTIYSDNGSSSVSIGASWTRGLALHPVGACHFSSRPFTPHADTLAAAGVTLIAFLLSLSSHITLRLFASLAAFLAGTIAFIAFLVDVALYAYVKSEAGKLDGVNAHTDTAPGFWVTFVSFILLFLAGGTVCFGRRRDRMAGATNYPMASSKFSRSWRDRFTRS
ncbi:uncharacterized protein C8Q71DRAFT_555726 [Rhodofomes roseus]|uniref:Pali-domain-containing protein n=1 Tax=Rhodofomes roseus TaxID=34475 RepID=A0ABQ8KI58_9APHY|nr:uncharacterized protein C8Q71DRAFT_555726 [Rhodofomes roseus]KAH9837677.1 hypothetical protein C8Q71DRAFT_555726 [Rhodofomes roseus]